MIFFKKHKNLIIFLFVAFFNISFISTKVSAACIRPYNVQNSDEQCDGTDKGICDPICAGQGKVYAGCDADCYCICASDTDDGGSGGAGTTDNDVDLDLDEPALSDLEGVISNIFKYVVGLAGLVFAGAVAYAGWKFSASLGDARGIDAAKQTLTYALIGFGVVVAFFAIFSIFVNLLGLSGFGGLGGLISSLFDGIYDLIGIAKDK